MHAWGHVKAPRFRGLRDKWGSGDLLWGRGVVHMLRYFTHYEKPQETDIIIIYTSYPLEEDSSCREESLRLAYSFVRPQVAGVSNSVDFSPSLHA